MAKSDQTPEESPRGAALAETDAEGLFDFDDGWYTRLERVLPALALRVAAANDLDPDRDGVFRVLSLHSVNAQASPGPEYEVYAGAALALIDLGMTLGDGRQTRPGVKRRYWDYSRKDGKPGFPSFSRVRLRKNLDEVSKLFVYGLGYLLLHEQYHYVNGHLAFLGLDESSVPFLEFTDGGAAVETDPLTRRALEWDADVHAAAMQFQAAGLASEKPPQTREWLEDVRENLVASFEGAAAMMGLQTVADRIANPRPENRRHPSAALRTYMLLRTYEVYLQERQCAQKDVASLISHAEESLRHIYRHLDAYRHLGVLEELEQALQAYKGGLSDDHPLQDERAVTYQRLDEILPKLHTAAARAHDLLGIRE